MIEEELNNLGPVPFNPCGDDLKERRKKLDHLLKVSNHIKERILTEFKYLRSVCPHNNINSRTCGNCGMDWD